MRRSKSAWLSGAASALLFLATAHSFAQSSATSQIPGLKLSGDQPIQIESDKLEVRQADSMAVFRATSPSRKVRPCSRPAR